MEVLGLFVAKIIELLTGGFEKSPRLITRGE